MNATHLVPGLAVLLLAPVASGQEVRCVLAEGGPLPGVPGHTVDSINNTDANGVGGYACTVNSTDGVTTLSHVWGNPQGGVGGPLQTEATIGTLEQTSFESFFGFDDAGVACYSPSCNDTVSGATGLDGVWLGDSVVAIEDDPIPSLPGKVWRFGSRPNVTRDGVPAWVGGINDGVSGASEGEGLFYGLGAAVVYKSGDTPTGAPAAIATSGIDFDFAFSAFGTRHLTGVELALATSEDYTVVLDGVVLFLGGAIVREGQPIPAVVGGLPGESWDNFDFYGVTESGPYFFTGDTDGATGTDEFLLKDGVILYREGDVLDGRTLTGSIEGAAMNENGEIAFVWDVVDAVAGDLEALYFEDQLVLVEGDNVDVTGDGVPDPNATISGFTGIAAVTLGPNRVIYFTADVDTMGTSSTSDDVECFFAATPAGTPDFLASPLSLSVSAGGVQDLFVQPGAAFADELYWIAGSVSGTAPGFAFGGLAIPLNPDFYLFLTINKPNQPPLVDTFGTLGGAAAPTVAAGAALAGWDLPAGVLPGLAGVTASHAFVVLDAGTLLPLHVSATTALTFAP